MVREILQYYDDLGKIGQGGMANINLIRDKQTKRLYAIKLLKPEQIGNAIIRKRFENEFQIAKKMNSPYITKFYDGRSTPKYQYIIMEYVDGYMLKEHIAKKIRLNIEEVVEFSKQIALGIQKIHEAGVVHRDIKSSNIMITKYGQIKIIDFGIAVSDQTETMTKADSIIGSVQYLAPERIDKVPATPQWDIYSVGILMFEMLVGRVPFKGKNHFETAMLHKSGTVYHVNKIYSNIPQSLANVIIKATAKNPSQRYSSMKEMYTDLSTVLNKDRIYEPVLNLNKKKKKTFKEIINSTWMLATIISLAVVIAIVIAILVTLIVTETI